MPRDIVVFEATTQGRRQFRILDWDESGELAMVHGDEPGDYGAEAHYSKNPFFEWKRLGMTALEASNTVYDDAQAHAFISEGVDAMHDAEASQYKARGETPPWLIYEGR